MASKASGKAEKEVKAQKPKSASATKEDVITVELPAPTGWTKKYTPRKSGTPKRNEIVFVSPTGEELKSKKQLEQFLKAHPGGPAFSEFDWGTGDTPRRSARIVEKTKATESPENEPPPKKRGGSSGPKKKGKSEDSSAAEKVEASVEEDSAADAKEPKKSLDAEMEEVKDDKKGTTSENEDSSATEKVEASQEDDPHADAEEPKNSLDEKIEEVKNDKGTRSEDIGEDEVAFEEATAAADAEEANPNEDTKMEVDVQEKSSEVVAPEEALIDQKAVVDSDKTEEMLAEKVENAEAPDEDMDSDTKEVEVENNTIPDTKLDEVEKSPLPDTKEGHVENDLIPDTKEGTVEKSYIPDTNEGQVGSDLLPEVIDMQVDSLPPAVQEKQVSELPTLLSVSEKEVETSLPPAVADKVYEAPTALAVSDVAGAEKEVKDGAQDEKAVEVGKVGEQVPSKTELEGAQSFPDNTVFKDSVEADTVGEEVPSPNEMDAGQSLPGNSVFKDGQEASPKTFEESHQPKSSPVNC